MQSTTNIPIVVSNLSLGYDSAEPLLPRFSVSAQKGEFIALIGRNGVGKSTFIRTIFGVQQPLQGNIFLNGTSVVSLQRSARAKLIAYVPSEQMRIPNLFIRDFVALARYPHLAWPKILTVKDRELVDEAIDMVGIGHLANKDMTAISDGERQRAMIAFALAQDSQIILLDEPTAYLDLPNKFEVVRLLSTLAVQKNKTVIYSTHDLQGAISEVDTIWMLLEQGFVSGAPEDIALNNHFQQMLGDSSMVFDRETGAFKSHKPLKQSISLLGTGEVHFWTKRMLERLGYSVESGTETAYRIDCPADDNLLWSVYQDNTLCHSASSLSALAQWLKQHSLQ